MKKYLVLVLGMMLVLGFAASAFAIHAEIPSDTQAVVAKGTSQITLGGEIRVRGWYVDNITGTRRAISYPGDTGSQAWYDQRVRLNLNAAVSKNTTGYIALESTNDSSSIESDTYTWGSLNQKHASQLQMLEAWILHKGSGLLGIPAGIKVGHMPLALGEKQFLDLTKFGTDAIVFFMDPTKELHIGLLTAKLYENSTPTNSYGDQNAYAALMTYKSPVGLFGINYFLATSDDIAYGAKDLSFQNLGLHANGKVAGLSYNVEFDQQFGKHTPTTDFKGWGLMVGAGYTVNPVTIRAQYAQGSGDKSTTGDIEEFQNFSGNDIHYTQIYEYTTQTASGKQIVVVRDRATGIANTTYYRFGLDVSPMKDLSASLDMFILRATKVAAGSKKIGNEYNLKLAYKIDKNLTYSVMAGYLDTQKAFEDGNSAGRASGTTAGRVATSQNKNITQLMHAITLSF